MRVSCRKRGRNGYRRPEDQSADDERLALEPIAYKTCDRPKPGVYPHESCADDSKLHVAQIHFRFEQFEHREDGLPVRVVEKTYEPEHRHDPPLIASRNNLRPQNATD